MFERLAVIGLGNISIRHRRNLKSLFPNCQIVGMSASGKEPTQSVPDIDQLVVSLDKVIELKPALAIIASPASSHVTDATELIAAGIPVLIEKPVSLTFQQCEPLLATVINSSVTVAVGYCLRYMPAAKKVKALLEQDIIGKVHTVSVNVGQYLPDWRPNKDYRKSVSAQPTLGGGVLLELSHELDYLQWFLGDFHVAYAQLRNSGQLDLVVEEIADMILLNDEGVTCHVHMDFLQRAGQRFCSLIGEKARLDWDVLNNTIVLHGSNGSEVLFDEPSWDRNVMYLDMLQDFVANIQGNKHSCVSVMEAAKTLTLIDNIKRNAGWELKR